jgi:transposase
MDGKLLLATNTQDLTPELVVGRYKSLVDIERGFRVLKSDTEIGPIRHRLPQRIRAHASICFMALIMYRVMRQRLKDAGSGWSPDSELSQLKRIQHHRIEVNEKPLTGISTLTQDQKAILMSLQVNKPTEKGQLSLL